MLVWTHRHKRAWVNARSNSKFELTGEHNAECWMLIARRLVASLKLPQIVAFHARLAASYGYNNWPQPAIEMPDQPQTLAAPSPLALPNPIITDTTRLICKTDVSVGDQRSLQVRPGWRTQPQRTLVPWYYVNFRCFTALAVRGPW